MKRYCIFRYLSVICVLWMFAIALPASVKAQGAQEVVVQVRQGVDPAVLARGRGIRPNFVYQTVVNGFAGSVNPGQLRALRNDPRVLSVSPNRTVTAFGQAAPLHHRPGHGGGPGGGGDDGDSGGSSQVVPAGIERIGASPATKTFAYTGAGIGVAVLDTGIDLAHGDLNVVSGYNAVQPGSSSQDDNGHGTHVAGIVAALDNDQDVVGVAPDAWLYGVKVLNSMGSGSDATIIKGLDWVAEHAFDDLENQIIHVVNMSLGRAGTLNDNPTLRSAVQKLYDNGVSIVVAAGNDCNAEVSDFVPATYPEVMAIASTTAQDGKGHKRFGQVIQDTASAFTTDGKFEVKNEYPEEPPIGVTISAPGESHENVSGATLELVGILSTQLGGGTTRMAGTSMSSPHAAGVVALLYEKADGTLHPEDFRMALMNGVLVGDAPFKSPASCYTYDKEREGILNAESALNLLN